MDAPEQAVKQDLVDWLESKRRHVRQQFEAMPEADRRRSQVPSGWTPRGLLHHLALDVERVWFRAVMAGESVRLPRDYEGWTAPDDLSDEELVALYADECARAAAVAESLSLDAAPRWWLDGAGDPPYSSLREVLLHVVIETATHAGHLDVCRELIDGGQRLVLDDPDA